MSRALLARACASLGIATRYRDVWGKTHEVPAATRIALLEAMGVRTGTQAALEDALREREARVFLRLLPPVQVARAGGNSLEVPVTLPAAHTRPGCAWILRTEDGACHAGAFDPETLHVSGQYRSGRQDFVRRLLRLPGTWPPGYHRLEISAAQGRKTLRAAMPLIIAPPHCHLPDAVTQGRVWGPMVNLHALRSERDWGIGDYTSLRDLAEIAAESGASLIGTSPLHALFPHDPDHASPYSPASRVLLNVLHLDPESMPDFAECAAARVLAAAPEFQAGLRALRAADLVDYRRMAGAKFRIFEALYAHFRERHLAAATSRGRAFRAFRRSGGAALRLGSLFCALQEYLGARHPEMWGWRSWPEQYRDPRSAAVAEFAREHAQRVEYHDYLQWNAELQLETAGRRARELRLGIGLYRDLAVGIDPGGAEAWADQELYARNAAVGCPPDEFNPAGQNWGLPPVLPARLAETAYASFIAVLRANMRHAGALRIDHVMSLTRLFWIPAGAAPGDGAYVSYPIDDLLGIVALESRRNRCMVIGEDLGTLPRGLAAKLRGAAMLSYRLLYFERESDGSFRNPRRYPAQALAAVGTHDLPPLRAYWRGCDLDLRARLQLYPDDAARQQQIAARARDRARLLAMLAEEALLPPGVAIDPAATPDMTPELALAVHRLLARTPSRVLSVQAGDVFGETDQPNFPATTREQHPNWRHRLKVTLERWAADGRFHALAAALCAERASRPFAIPRMDQPSGRKGDGSGELLTGRLSEK